MMVYSHTNDPVVASVLADAENDLAQPARTALKRINDLLATGPAETEVLHRYARDLHALLETLSSNQSRRASHITR